MASYSPNALPESGRLTNAPRIVTTNMTPMSLPQGIGKRVRQRQYLLHENPGTAADRAILYTALSLFIGTVFFHLFWYKGKSEQLVKRTRRILTGSIAALGLALLLQLPIQTKANAGGGWGSAFQPGYIRETLFETAGGSIWIIQAALFVLLALSVIPAIRKTAFHPLAIGQRRSFSFSVSCLPRRLPGMLLSLKKKRSAF